MLKTMTAMKEAWEKIGAVITHEFIGFFLFFVESGSGSFWVYNLCSSNKRVDHIFNLERGGVSLGIAKGRHWGWMFYQVRNGWLCADPFSTCWTLLGLLEPVYKTLYLRQVTKPGRCYTE